MKALVTNLIEDYRQQASYWAGSLFESVTHFSTDYKGKFGEELLFKLIKELTDIPVQWDADSNTANDDGVYDLFWFLHNGKRRVEVKTSGRTVANGKPIGWQHENVYFSDNKWDKLVFLDYDRNDVMFITIVDYDEVVKDNNLDLSIFGKKGHQRKNEEGKAKVDFSMKSIRNGIDAGVTFEYDFNNPCDELLALFLLKKLA
jgi:hypothetical protein|tara:strand:+ start:495 stop:1100 length:606 start_codon:yes stop_codon:yes gene_type:complete